MENLDKILEIIKAIVEVLGSPIVLGVIALLVQKFLKVKADTEQINQLFTKIIASVKAVEKELGLDKVTPQGALDPRMQRAIELFDGFKSLPEVSKSAKRLGINLEKLDTDEVQDIIEKVLHAGKLAVSFDVVKEIQNKKNVTTVKEEVVTEKPVEVPVVEEVKN